MPVANPLIRASLSHQIRDVLLKRIMSGELKPGDRLIELKIAAEMSTSQAPVREALRELEALGVIETLRNKGARVRVITDDELRQIYDVRAQLEAYATGLITELEIPVKSSLTDAVKGMKKAARAGDSIEFANMNSTFHRHIMEATGNRVLLDLWETLNVKSRTMVNVSRSSRNLIELAESHLGIINAIQEGKPSGAYTAALEHVLKNKPVTKEQQTGSQTGDHK